jgi:hypothetical protein
LHASSYSGNILISPEGITLENSTDAQINPDFLTAPANFIKYSIIPDNISAAYSQDKINTPLSSLVGGVQFIIDNPEVLEARTDDLGRLCIFVDTETDEC